jgi:hypothetical protein
VLLEKGEQMSGNAVRGMSHRPLSRGQGATRKSSPMKFNAMTTLMIAIPLRQ